LVAERAVSLRNPFRCGGTELPAPLLLSAKLLVLLVWRAGIGQSVPVPSNGHLPFLELLPAAPYVLALKATLAVTALALLFNRRPRLCALVAGACVLGADLSSRAYFAYNRAFLGCVLIAIGLTEAGRRPWVVRLQIALVYFGAGFNKLTDVDWRSGRFMAVWMSRFCVQPGYAALSGALPDGWLSRAMSWATIATELSIAVCFLVPRLHRVGIWLGLGLHTGLLVLTDRVFGVFFYAAPASYLAFIEWPAMIPIWESGASEGAKSLLRRLDLDGRLEWTTSGSPSESPPPWPFLRIRWGERTREGLELVRTLLLATPLSFFAGFAVLTIPQPASIHFRKWIALAILIALSPPTAWLARRFVPRANSESETDPSPA